MASFNANVFFFMYACGKQVSASTPNLRQSFLREDDRILARERKGMTLSHHDRDHDNGLGFGFGFAPLDNSSTYGSTTSLNAPAALSYKKSGRPRTMITSQCISPIPRVKPCRKPKRFKKPRCYKCNLPGHFAFHCKTRI